MSLHGKRSYYGTKLVDAWPQKSPAVPGKDTQEDGYGVEYEGGYRSWSPKDVFEKAYQPITAMSFGHAIEALKAGHSVARAGWNGKGMFLVLVPGNAAGGIPRGIAPHIDMFTAQGHFQPGWLASQADMLATDWTIVVN